jgi:hypothetical protein
LERTLKISPLLIKIGKGAVSIAVSSMPAFFSNFFNDVNPGIIKQIWWPTLLIAIVAAIVCYVTSKLLPHPALIVVAVSLLFVCFGSFAFLEMVALKVLHPGPAAGAVITRMLIVLIFASFSACVSLLLARLPDEWVVALFSTPKNG